jgi:hypothetical protein
MKHPRADRQVGIDGRAFRAGGRLLVGAAALLSACAASADTWVVLADGSGDAPTIQAAVDSTAPGDTVLVGPGVYVEQVGIPGRPLTVRGMSGAEATTIDAGGVGDTIAGWGVDLLVEDLRLIGAQSDGYGFGGAGLRLDGDASVRRCILESGVHCNGNLELTGSTVSGTSPQGLAYANVLFGGPSLRIEGCTFEEIDATVVQLWFQEVGTNSMNAVVRDNVFRSNVRHGGGDFAAIVAYDAWGASLDLRVENNLFVDNGAVGVGNVSVGVTKTRRGTVVAVLGNTFVDTRGAALDGARLPYGARIERNVFADGEKGLVLDAAWELLVVSCNLAWNNGVDWEGFPDPSGIDGNLTERPKFCDPVNGIYTVAANSPCLPANNDCGLRIGALGVGCDPVSVERLSWGSIKGLYR